MVSIREPGRKLRGGRRYFRGLVQWPRRIQIRLGGDAWYDLWHTHPDSQGWSTGGARARQAHLIVLFEAFRRALAQAAGYDGPAQVFVTVNSKDSPGDALYVHTPNPNAQNFPYTFEPYRWEGVRVPEWLRRYIDDQFEVGETLFEGETRYVVVPRGPRWRPAADAPDRVPAGCASHAFTGDPRRSAG
jgi:hypothetical protein